ncbi:MAG: acyl-CoA dehydratase activase-related protein [Bacillota bacterium]|nr:acyl-CoA dehydratase activase-related protein [Bacillota bacterium]
MKLKVGIPTTLHYYSFYPFWKAFFEQLNIDVITSPVTTKEIVDLGVAETVNDACVPIKIFHGHVMALKEKVDFLFIPRMVSMTNESTFCPKFLGLPNMIKASISNLPPIIEPRIDLKNSKLEMWNICRSIADRFTANRLVAFKAYRCAVKAQQTYEKLLVKKVKPLSFLQAEGKNEYINNNAETGLVKLAVLGYPYEVYDPFISVNVLKRLEEQGVEVVTLEMISKKELARYSKSLPKNLFWYYSNLVVRAGFYYLDHQVDGIIHVTAFGCGPDAMVDKLLELEAKERGQVPFMSLTIDEHSGEAGVATRIEAFVDMIRLRKEQTACG